MEDRFSETLKTVAMPPPESTGWIQGARRKRRRRQGLAAGAVGVVVLALAVPLGLNLVDSRIDALPADPTSPALTQVCQPDNALDPAVEVSGPEAFSRAVVCTGTILGEDRQEIELPSPLVREVASSVLEDSVPDGADDWSYEDTALLLITDDGGTVEMWQVSIEAAELAYLWKRDDQLMIWVPEPGVASQLREYLGD